MNRTAGEGCAPSTNHSDARMQSMTLKVAEGEHGWYCVAYWDAGEWPGSVQGGAGSFATAEEAFAYLLSYVDEGARFPTRAVERSSRAAHPEPGEARR